MKNKNNMGFTLVELLAVVVILLAISVAAISSISASIERNKDKQNKAKIDVIISYAKLYYDEHKNRLGASGRINIDDLGLDQSEKMDADNEVICGYVTYNIANNTFEFDEDAAACRGTNE